ncbi:hypothetical protein CICLE_v10017306mg [Citrus x clementina]|uniref:Uncharacterized protein n=1 Tax=Citrus clementina TaxID=85681 RepID=V4ULG0_CITCL|nr:hypothetical protein CICLE_v10017306mg [Citrus x clementina]
MDITPKLVQYKYQFSVAMVVSLILGLLSYGTPRMLTILAYFWPLLASTTVFLLLIIAFGGLSQLANEAHGERAGEGLLDYVAGAGRSEHNGPR